MTPSATDLRALAAQAEKRGDMWQRWANEAFEGGRAVMGQAYSARATYFYDRVSELGIQAAELEARWPEERAA